VDAKCRAKGKKLPFRGEKRQDQNGIGISGNFNLADHCRKPVDGLGKQLGKKAPEVSKILKKPGSPVGIATITRGDFKKSEER